MFRQERCDLCGQCLIRCHWIGAEPGQAVQWMKAMIAGEPTPVLGRCITCFACNEFCPTGADPFDLFAGLQKRYRVFATEEAAAKEEEKYRFSGDLKGLPRALRLMTTCVFGKTEAHLLQGSLYDLPRVGGKPFYCWLLFGHWGAESIQRKHARDLVERLAATGAEEVVCFHDDCYAMLAKLAPEYGVNVPFRPVHLSEHLVECLRRRADSIRPLNIRVAYQRPCASRFTPEKEPFIDELFGLMGVRRVDRQFDREEALCCAGIMLLLGNGDPRPHQEQNIRDAKAAGAQAMVCLCPMCIHNLSGVAAEHGLPLIFIGDLARMAIGEIPVPSLPRGT